MLKAIFYARFHPERGPSVIHQYPNGSILPFASEQDKKTLIAWRDISSYIIPPYDLCDRSLSIHVDGYIALGFPVSLEDAKYDRNRFTFNVCFVLKADEDTEPWKQVVQKTAAFFKAMEEEDGLLQAEEVLPGLRWADEDGYPAKDVGVIHTLLEAMYQDMNRYREMCIRIDDLNVLNLKLQRPRVPPAKVHAWNVPLLIRALPDREEWTRDLTLQRIHPHLDGVKHVQRIAELSDVELKLVKRAVRELLYHERAMLLDIFHFQAIYTTTSVFADFVSDDELLEECSEYVAVEPSSNPFANAELRKRASAGLPSKPVIIDLYASLAPGVPVHDFPLTHEEHLANIDIRRFITFGVIKGFLRRVHKYALHIPSASTMHLSGNSNSSPSKSKPKSNEDAVKEFDRAWKKAALSSGWATPPHEPPPSLPKSDGKGVDEEMEAEDEKLRGYLDGLHCLDEVCVAMRMSERKVVERLRDVRRFGEVVLFNK